MTWATSILTRAALDELLRVHAVCVTPVRTFLLVHRNSRLQHGEAGSRRPLAHVCRLR